MMVSLAGWLVRHQNRRTAPGRVAWVDSDVLGKGGPDS
jgi:hypothetical protein